MRRRAFTLVELLIVIAILSLTAGVIGVNIRGFLLQQRVLDEMGQVQSQLKIAQELMMMANLDSEVQIQKTGEGFLVEILPKSSTTQMVKPLLKQPSKSLSALDQISFENAADDSLAVDRISLKFFSKGFVMSRGVLTIKAGNISRSIILSGSPGPLSLIETSSANYPYSPELFQWIEQVTAQTGAETKKESK